MTRLLVLCLLLVIAIAVVGYYRDWFTVAGTNDDQKVNIQVTVDKDKVREDEQRAKEKLQKLGSQIKEGAGKFSEKVKEGTTGKKTDEPPQ
jgi:uncharacterized lipoprotein YehR (DUF1307 family)